MERKRFCCDATRGCDWIGKKFPLNKSLEYETIHVPRADISCLRVYTIVRGATRWLYIYTALLQCSFPIYTQTTHTRTHSSTGFFFSFYAHVTLMYLPHPNTRGITRAAAAEEQLLLPSIMSVWGFGINGRSLLKLFLLIPSFLYNTTNSIFLYSSIIYHFLGGIGGKDCGCRFHIELWPHTGPEKDILSQQTSSYNNDKKRDLVKGWMQFHF